MAVVYNTASACAYGEPIIAKQYECGYPVELSNNCIETFFYNKNVLVHFCDALLKKSCWEFNAPF